MSCAVRLSREAEKDLLRLHRSNRRLYQRVLRKLESLAHHPRSGKPLVGDHQGGFSLRVGDYRIVYEIHPKAETVFVLTVKHRRHVY